MTRWMLVVIVSLSGCASIFGLDSPAHDEDPTDDGGMKLDGAQATDGEMPTIDAASFDPANCPAAYTGINGAPQSSRYRVIGATAMFLNHYGDCNDDAVGRTHLVSLETNLEHGALATALLGGTTQFYYLGGVQMKNQPQPDDGWLVYTGAPLLNGLWGSGQPNDDNPGENGEEQLLTLDSNAGLYRDASGDVLYGAVCECDGRPIAANVLTALQ